MLFSLRLEPVSRKRSGPEGRRSSSPFEIARNTPVRGTGLTVAVATGLTLLNLLHALPAQAEDARVLPAGRSRLSFTFAQSGQISSTFDRTGDKKGITDAYNVRLDAESLSKMNSDISQAYGILDSWGFYYDASKANGPSQGITTQNTGVRLSEQLRKGDLGVRAEAQQTVYAIQYQHGLTDQISVGFGIPIKKTKVRTRYGIDGQSTLAALKQMTQGYASTGMLNQLYEGLAYLDAANTETLQQILGEAGYQRFGDTETTGIGDVVFGGRYNYLKTRDEQWINSTQLGVTAPTGELKSPSTLTGVDNGQGCWDLSVAHITNFSPPIMKHSWLFSHGVHYTHRLPGSREYRVKQSSSDFLPSAAGDETIDMQLGPKFWTNVGAKYSFTPSISAETNYEWYWKGQDYYQGSRNVDYTYLSDDTKMYLETLNIGLSVSTIHAFLNHNFPLPADVSLNFYHPVRGMNSPVAPYATMEMALYF